MWKRIFYYFFKTDGERLLASFSPRSVKKLDIGAIEFYSQDKRYVFSYCAESEEAEIWQDGDLVYSTDCPLEAFKLYLDLKCRRIN